MLRARQSFGLLPVVLAGIVVAMSTWGCLSTRSLDDALRHAVVVNLRPPADYPVLSKKQGNRLIWFAADALKITVHVGTNPVPFKGMTDPAGGPCRGDDCLIWCPPNQTVCVSGPIAIPDQQIPIDGIRYDYDLTLLPQKNASADPGFIIKP